MSNLSELLPVGTRIRFTKTLTSPSSGDHPGLIYAKEGDGGEIVGHGCKEGYWVKWDKCKEEFGASTHEFEVANPIQSGLDRTTGGWIGQP